MTTHILSSSSLTGDKVVNANGDDLGDIKDLMIDVTTGSVEYAVLSFGGFLGLGNKLFAVPLSSMHLDTNEKKFILDVSKEHLENAPGFDKDNWPNFASPEFRTSHTKYWAQVRASRIPDK